MQRITIVKFGTNELEAARTAVRDFGNNIDMVGNEKFENVVCDYEDRVKLEDIKEMSSFSEDGLLALVFALAAFQESVMNDGYIVDGQHLPGGCGPDCTCTDEEKANGVCSTTPDDIAEHNKSASLMVCDICDDFLSEEDYEIVRSAVDFTTIPNREIRSRAEEIISGNRRSHDLMA